MGYEDLLRGGPETFKPSQQFALVGMGAYITLYVPELPIKWCAVIFALIFGTINLFGAKKTGGLQIILVFSLLAILAWFITLGIGHTDTSHFAEINATGLDSIFAIVNDLNDLEIMR